MNLQDLHILLVDDEPTLLKMVYELLKNEGYTNIDTVSNCMQAYSYIQQNDYRLVLLDIMLPDGDGFILFEKIRQTSDTPVIFLSAKDEDSAKLRGLGLGADDYITKPFLPEELLLRIKAVLKRCWNLSEKTTAKSQIGNVIIDWEGGTIHFANEVFPMTAKEYTLLKKLYDNRGKIISINTLCDTLWPDGCYGYENSLMVHIRRLREKIEENPSKPQHLITVRGLGYKLV